MSQSVIRKGKRADSGFKKEAWSDVVAEFNQSFGTNYQREKLKNHYQVLKGQFSTVRKLRDQSGFGWDDQRSVVVAPEHVWEEYIKSHPKAKPFRDRPFPLYNSLQELAGDALATGKGRKASKASEKQADDVFGVDDEITDLLGPVAVPTETVTFPSPPWMESRPASPTASASVDESAARDGVQVPMPFSSHGSMAYGQESPLVFGADCDCEKDSGAGARKRVRTNGTMQLADAVTRAAMVEEAKKQRDVKKQELRKEQALIKREKFPNMKEAMKIFAQEVKDHFDDPLTQLTATKVLRSEENSAFYLMLPPELCWSWLKEEGNL